MKRKIGPGKPLEELVKGSLDYTIRTVSDAFWKQFRGQFDRYESNLWIVEVFAGYIVVNDYQLPADEFYLVTYQLDSSGLPVFAAREAWEVVELTYQPKAAPTTEVVESSKNGKGKKTERLRFTERAGQVMLLEAAEEGKPRKVKAVGITADVVNGNGRRYPAAVLQAAVEELNGHLHESAGQGRLLQTLGEVEHPSDKSGRANYLETVIKWSGVTFDGGQVLLEGELLGTSKGRDVQALMEGEVFPGISQRGYGQAKTVRENGQQIDEVVELHITGYDLVMEPSDPNASVTMLESKQTNQREERDMTPEELAQLIQGNPDLFRGVVADEVRKMSAAQLSALEEQVRSALGIGANDDLPGALKAAAEARHTLDEQRAQAAVETAITEHTKGLPYGEKLNASFVEAVRTAKPATPEAVKAICEAKRGEYDRIVADLKLGTMGFPAGVKPGSTIQAIGPVFERETGTPEYARGAHEFMEAMVVRGMVSRHDLRQPKTLNEIYAAQLLERFDALYKAKLIVEARLLEEAEATSDLSLPYSVARTVIAAAFPELIAAGIFDFGVTDQSPTVVYYEAYAGETGSEPTVTNEDVTASNPLGSWVNLANKRLNPGTVVVTDAATDLVTYTEGTDYIIDYVNGKLLALAAGTISAGEALHVDYKYMAIRKGEGAAIQRGKMTLSSKTLEVMADRLAAQINHEAVVFSRSQIGWDATARTLAGLAREIRRKQNQGTLYLALTAALSVANNIAGTWTAASDSLDALVKYIGVARTKISNRYYEPTALVLSTSNGDTLANWDGFTQAGSRPDATLNALGYIGSVKGLPVVTTTEFPDGYLMVVNRELVAHRTFQPMVFKGPFPSYDSNGLLIASDQYYAEEYNGETTPVTQKSALVKIA